MNQSERRRLREIIRRKFAECVFKSVSTITRRSFITDLRKRLGTPYPIQLGCLGYRKGNSKESSVATFTVKVRTAKKAWILYTVTVDLAGVRVGGTSA